MQAPVRSSQPGALHLGATYRYQSGRVWFSPVIIISCSLAGGGRDVPAPLGVFWKETTRKRRHNQRCGVRRAELGRWWRRGQISHRCKAGFKERLKRVRHPDYL